MVWGKMMKLTKWWNNYRANKARLKVMMATSVGMIASAGKSRDANYRDKTLIAGLNMMSGCKMEILTGRLTVMTFVLTFLAVIQIIMAFIQIYQARWIDQ